MLVTTNYMHILRAVCESDVRWMTQSADITVVVEEMNSTIN